MTVKFLGRLTSAAWLMFMSMVSSTQTASDMGPAAFLWPPDRTWSASTDNTAPCGSSAGVGNRTNFPLTGGKVSLVDQDEGYDVQLSISYSNDPQSNADFSVLISSSRIKELDLGHTCVSVSDPVSTISAGDNATLQIMYSAVFDSTVNETFYACADITYVKAADFSAETYCFNYTESSDGSTTSSTSTATSSAASPGSGTSGISKGAIAGAVVGSVVGAALVLGLALFFYRRRQTAIRRQRLAEMELRARNVPSVNTGKRLSSQASV